MKKRGSFILIVLAVMLLFVSSIGLTSNKAEASGTKRPAKEVSPPPRQAPPESSTSGIRICQRMMTDETCVWWCCTDSDCFDSPC